MSANLNQSDKPTMAELADRHELYEKSVQAVDDEVVFLDETFTKVRGRKALSLREDFCGTAAASCAWVARNNQHTAVGVDIDPEVLTWGRNRNVASLNVDQQARIKLLEGNVLTADTDPVDLLVAFNFSYWIFKTRDELREYFEKARAALKDDGLFMLDLFGGMEAYDECKEKTKLDGFTYVWHQAKYDPVTGHMKTHIHFKFPDGSKMKQAFTYEWRLWSIPEVRELLAEAGFSKSTVYWEGTDKDGDGNGEWEPVAHGEADPAWITYLVAER